MRADLEATSAVSMECILRGGLGEPHMGNHFDGIRMSGLRHDIHSHRRHFGDEFCSGGDSDCGLYGCRYLWESQIHCY